MVMCSISSISVLLHCYRKEIRRLLPVIAVLGFGFVWSLFSWGTWGKGWAKPIRQKQLGY